MIQSCRSSCSSAAVAIETGHVAMVMLCSSTADRTTAGPDICMCVCVCMALLHHQVIFLSFLQASRQIKSSLDLFNL